MTAQELETILRDEGAERAIAEAEKYISTSPEDLDFAYYILGNAYRKMGDWQGAINNYLEAIDINPQSPAKQAYDMANDILNFFNKDMYNQ
ncbi:MAG: tetratricopeptide repeat protein [Bacteroidales bacterium]|nr:tetratricopeptide repeat protein [Bacteroidales bacterium]MBQ1887018.1 tetratricopeptide repeat protein [Bacteroidales bacterium]